MLPVQEDLDLVNVGARVAFLEVIKIKREPVIVGVAQEVLLGKDGLLRTVAYVNLVKKVVLRDFKEVVVVPLVQEVVTKTKMVPSFVNCAPVVLSVLFSEQIVVLFVRDVLQAPHLNLASLSARRLDSQN